MMYSGWIGSFLVLLAMYVTGRKSRWGFFIGGVAEGFWLLYSIHIQSLELGLMSIMFVVMYACNFFKWSDDGKQRAEVCSKCGH